MKRNSFGLWLMMRLLAKHFGELSISKQQEVINELAAERKYKVDSLRAAERRRESYRRKQQEEQEFRKSVSRETEDLLSYLDEQRRAAG